MQSRSLALPWSPPVASLMAATSGLALVLFLAVHLAGVSLALLDPIGFERQAAALHRQVWLAPVEVVLALALLGHPVLTLGQVLANRRARPAGAPAPRSRREGAEGWVATLAARSLPWTGALLLGFLLAHLLQLRWHRPPAGAELAALGAVLSVPLWAVLHSVAGAAAGLHLLHGIEGAHRSLGLLERQNGSRIRAAGRALALLLGGGFALVPPALLLLQPWAVAGG